MLRRENMKKKLLLTIAIIFVFACLFAVSISATTIGDFEYTLNSNTGEATFGDNRNYSGTTVVIPEKVTYNDVEYTVTAVASNAFYGNQTITTIYFPPTITKLEGYTFSQAPNLTAVYIDLENLVSIGNCGLTNSSVTNACNVSNYDIYFYPTSEYGKDVPTKTTHANFESITSIGASAFQGANLENITLGENLTVIREQTFRQSAMKSFLAKGQITKIGNWSFQACKSLETVRIESNSLKTIENTAFNGCTAITGIYIDLSNCTAVDGSAFEFSGNCQGGTPNYTAQWYNLDGEKVVDLSNLQTIGTEAFGASNIGSATIIWPKELTSISDQAFRKANITGTVYINAKEGVTLSIAAYVLNECNFDTLILGKGVTSFSLDGGFKTAVTIVALADSITLPTNLFKGGSSTLYCKSLVNDASQYSNVTINTISEGEAIYSVCGVIANVTLASDSSKVTIGEVVHKYSSKGFDNTYCPINTYTKYVCVTCALEQYKDLEENIVEKNTLVAHVFDFDNNEMLVSVLFVDNNFLANGIKTVCCDNCTQTSTEEEATFPALFISYGYSHAYENGKGALMQSVGINKEAFQKYKALNPEMSISYGVVAASGANPTIYTGGSFIDKAVVVDFTNRLYDIMEMKIYGISETTAQTQLYCCGYIIIDGDITYIDNGALSDTAQTKSYSDYGTEFNTVEPVEAIVPTKETYSQVA